ncbi:MAG: hypothetical protein RIR18_791, partial [Pseudomonadota bacterium]
MKAAAIPVAPLHPGEMRPNPSFEW